MTSHDMPSGRPRALLVAGLALIAATAVLGVILAIDPLGSVVQPLDDAWRRSVSSPGPEEGPVVVFLQAFGTAVGWVGLGVFVPVALVVARRWWSAVYWEVALVAGAVLSQVGKAVVGRPRPAADPVAELYGPLFSDGQAAYPSGHSTAAGVVLVAGAAVLPIAWRRWWWALGALLAVAMVWQRTLVNAHWLTDTLGGLALGTGCALVAWWAMLPLLARDPRPAP